MFVEPNMKSQHHVGWIEVITGCMFSGKTEELIRRVTRAKIARQQVMMFKPALDNRYHSKHIVSHDANAIYSQTVESAQEIWQMAQAQEAKVIGIDEGQFFDEAIVEVCNALANAGKRVIVAGLDMDYRGKPFGPMPFLMAVAEFVTKVHAICVISGELANYSYRKVNSDETVLLGETEVYEARSRQYFFNLETLPTKRLPSQEGDSALESCL
ncbi:MAG: thymidine kinase [Microscillaceae bacterium]|nr:thymidine kinase [Microscillaceae bacterium]